jgi:hypothetical protein
MESGVAELNRVPARGGESVLEAAVEEKAAVVVSLGDDSPRGVVDCDQGIDILSKAAADHLESESLTRRHID